MNVNMGILLVLAASFVLSAMNAAVKFLTLQGYPTLQITFFAGFIAFCCVFAWMALKKKLATLKVFSPLLGLYILAAVGAGVSLFYAFGSGKLAEVGTIVAAAPLMIAGLAFFLLHERLRPFQAGLIVVGFLGILCMFKPRPELVGYEIFCWALFGTFLFSLSQIIVRKLKDSVPTLVFCFYFYLGFFAVTGLMMPYQSVSMTDVPFFLLTGACEIVSLVLLYSAFKLAPASVVAPFQYSGVLWSALFGYVFWHERLDIWTLAGAAIIVGSGILFARSSQHDA